VDVGVGLPSAVPGTDGSVLVEWARRADRGPFASVGVLDRVAYDSYDPFVALSAGATVTERVRLVTMIAIGPLRPTALLAKQAAAIDRISGGRLTLGLALGARHDDYEAAGVDHLTRGRRFDDQLAGLRDIWEGKAIGPKPVQQGGPELLVGGDSGPAYARMARYADGYVHGGGPPRAFARAASQALAAWMDLGRPGRPGLWGQGYFALGDVDRGAEYLRDYYAFTGPFAEKIAAANLTTPQAVRDFVRGYGEAGCDHLILLPTVADPAQLERLADVLA
jgi:alkanesulfonate monooxygenase SsuD/methylene tetrahydromethanopterin reductase-like flavin-dependent oxidoreductase (luciferase family)